MVLVLPGEQKNFIANGLKQVRQTTDVTKRNPLVLSDNYSYQGLNSRSYNKKGR